MAVTTKLEALRVAAEQAEDAVLVEEVAEQETVPAAPTVIRTYTVTAHHPPQVLPLGRERHGKVTAINCTGRVACTLLDANGKTLITIDADGIDMACDIAFAGGAVTVSMKTANSIKFVIEE